MDHVTLRNKLRYRLKGHWLVDLPRIKVELKPPLVFNLHHGERWHPTDKRQLSLSVLPLEIGPQVSILSLDEVLETLADTTSSSSSEEDTRGFKTKKLSTARNSTESSSESDEGGEPNLTRELLHRIIPKPVPPRPLFSKR
ncbi:unnamed protein product [Enterobius vermicularis]|uniref:39S ribosomal protein L9, mitochondrial n=1 Tax=Enterobius vermicularis TaxID=51028 RepID=A0A0N4V026_ENTVE|nr:unnamed protein product [Enterobius vermicularis]